ncbi:hypothetical protein QYF36_022395 [Acer negundo]|nr:hypothetical protein QYF36_022395 [Acer negundo]
MRVVTANNGAQVRIFDTENFGILNQFSYDWFVNNITISPDGKLLAILGDSTECLIAEIESGKVVGNLQGHLDFICFSMAPRMEEFWLLGTKTLLAGCGT